MSTTEKALLGTANSMKAAASVCGISHRAVQAAKQAGCDAVKPSGRVDCDALLTWLGEHPETVEIAGQALSKDKETILKIRAERKLKEHILAEREGKYILTADAQKCVGDMIVNAKKVLLPGPQALAPQVIGVSNIEAEKLIRDWLNDALTQLSTDPLGEQKT